MFVDRRILNVCVLLIGASSHTFSASPSCLRQAAQRRLSHTSLRAACGRRKRAARLVPKVIQHPHLAAQGSPPRAGRRESKDTSTKSNHPRQS